MKNQCIIFILKNDESFLNENIDKIIDLSNYFDLYFVIRESKDRTNLILKTNNFINIEMSYDSGYYEALKVGFEFIKDMKYETWIEFGECKSLSIDVIDKLNDINKEFEFKKSVIFASNYAKKRKSKRFKLFIYFAIRKKIIDPYSRVKIYNKCTFDYIKNEFNCKMYPHNLLNLIYKKPEFLEVKIKVGKKNNKKFTKLISQKFYLFIYTVFILPYTLYKKR